MITDVEIGRDPGGNTDFGQLMMDVLRRAEAGEYIRIVSHGVPVARIMPPRTSSNAE